MQAILKIAVPVAFSHFLLMAMSLVDLVFIRQAGAEVTGAVGVGSALFNWTITLGIGLLAGLDYFVSTTYGAGQLKKGHWYLSQGLWLSAMAGVPLTGLLFATTFRLNWLGIHPDVVPPTREFLQTLLWGLFPVFIFTACRNYVTAIGRPMAPLVILLAANGLNALLDYLFIFGKGGFPAMGIQGVGLATTLSRYFLAAGLLVYIVRRERKAHDPLRWHDLRFQPLYFYPLLTLGVPATLHMFLEVGIFALSTLLAGGLTPHSLAAHEIVLNLSATSFVVTLGIGAATAVCVGQALGKQRPNEAVAMGWRGVGLATGFMLFFGAVLLFFPHTLLPFFSNDPTVLETATGLTLIVSAFQIVDGLQASLSGALRGIGNTRAAAWANLVGHWGIGLPTCLILCFRFHWGVTGVWVGLATGLFVVATCLGVVWTVRVRRGRFLLPHLT
jgi:MATE family multidrug resistance protein